MSVCAPGVGCGDEKIMLTPLELVRGSCKLPSVSAGI